MTCTRCRPAALALAALCAALSGALADTLPARSPNYAGNYATLTQDQKAPAVVAACIATAYDHVKASRAYDRLGFTSADIAAATRKQVGGHFSRTDRSRVSTTIAIAGEARQRQDGKWRPIVLRCGSQGPSLRAIELTPAN